MNIQVQTLQPSKYGVVRALVAATLLLSAAALAFAQASDGPQHPMQDALLDHMVGSWRLTGRIAGQAADHRVEAGWVLNHQFLRIHETDQATAGQPAYEAMVFIGYDNAGERYVAHWIDIYGGRFSETLGYGKREGDAIAFTFDYPDGAFHTVFRFEAPTATWRWEMDNQDKDGHWKPFARAGMQREAAKRPE